MGALGGSIDFVYIVDSLNLLCVDFNLRKKRASRALLLCLLKPAHSDMIPIGRKRSVGWNDNFDTVVECLCRLMDES